jgi:hypothetical protein
MSKETLVTKESSEKLKKYAKIRKAADSKWVDDTKNVRNVGNNGYIIGQEFELDGTFDVEEIKSGNKTTGAFFACGTKQGVKLSLASLMGLSSLNGYKLEGEDIAYLEPIGEDGPTDKQKAESVKFTAKVDSDVDETFVGWEGCPTRDIYDMVVRIENEDIKLAGIPVVYKGQVIRGWDAKKGGEDINTGAKYVAGAHRVSRQNLFKVG